MSTIANLSVAISANSDGLQRELNKAKKKTQTFGSSFGKTMKTAGASSLKLAKNVTKVGVAIGAAVGYKAVSTFANFEDAMLDVKSVTGATESQMKSMSDVAKDLGSNTQFSASQAGEAMAFLGKAGYDTNQILEATPGLLNLAAAGNLDLAAAADIASNVVSGMGLSAADTGRVADVLAQTAASANTSVAQLGLAMTYAAPVAKDFGISVEETAAYLGKLSDAGIQADKAGTGLRRILGSLAKPSGDAAAVMDELGISVFDSAGKFKGAEEVFGEFSDAMDKGLISQTDMFTLFGKQGAGVASVLFESADAAAELTDQLEASEGAAEDMANIKQGGITGQINQMKSATEGLLLTIAEGGVMDVVTDVLTKVTDGIRGLTKVIGGEQTLGDFFKEFFGVESGGEFAKGLAEGFNESIQKLIKFHEKIDWADLGDKVGAAIATFLTETDWVEVGKAIWNGMVSAIKFAGNLFISMAKGIWDALKEKLPTWLVGESAAGSAAEALEMSKGTKVDDGAGAFNLAGDAAEFKAAKLEVVEYLKALEGGAVITDEMVKEITKHLQVMSDEGNEQAQAFAESTLKWLEHAEDEAVGHSIIPDMVDAITAEMKKMAANGDEEARAFANNVIQQLESGQTGAHHAASMLADTVKSAFSGMSDAGRDAGNAFLKGLMPGLTKAKDFDVGGFVKQGLDEAAKHSKKAFKVQKGIATAEAIINTFTGATKALAQGGIFGPIMAGLVIASGMVQVAAIRNQKYQGLKTGGTVNSGGMFQVGENGPENVFLPGGASVAANGSALGPDGGKPQMVTINVQGFGADQEKFVQNVMQNSPTIIGPASQYYQQSSNGLTTRRV